MSTTVKSRTPTKELARSGGADDDSGQEMMFLNGSDTVTTSSGDNQSLRPIPRALAAEAGPSRSHPPVAVGLPKSVVNDAVLQVAESLPERQKWDNKLQFMLSAIGYSVGLGNVWRFPYLVQQNGGGAFLIPFFVMLLLEGIPLFLVELALGQKLRQGSLGVWNIIHPWLGGLGIASTLVAFLVGLYYNVIITWCFYYLFNSFQSPLPWSTCPLDSNGTAVKECTAATETAYFWYRTALDISPSVDQPEGIKWWMALCLLLSWIIVYFITMRGIQSSGKVVYFTALFPYAVLTIFFIRGITLKGAGAGLAHMLQPQMHKLLDPTVWLDAATQVFYSFNIGFGSLIAFGSYNPPRNNCVKDTLILSVCNAATAIYASIVIFAILGFKAVRSYDLCVQHDKGLIGERFPGLVVNGSLSDEAYANFLEFREESKDLGLRGCNLEAIMNESVEGTGLVFIVFTQAIVELPAAPFWAILFFLMLLALGVGSQIGTLEGVISTVFDIQIVRGARKEAVSAAVCIISYLIGLLFVTGSGEYWVKIFDSFAGTTGLIFIALLESIAVMYIYGHRKFSQDILQMTGHMPGPYWQITWRFVGPVLISVLLVASIIYRSFDKPAYYAWNADEGKSLLTPYPQWVLIVGGLLATLSVLPIPVVFLLRRFQFHRLDTDINKGVIRRNETTISTKQMMTDVDEYGDNAIEEEDEEEALGRLEMTTSNRTFTIGHRDEH
ncbi:sodium- and chloride-dependent transporter XTRP3 [Daphnia magna]|uniref:sodium- and chloride-dependent transporter XTRP3 n=1 Tax=Daphnia magna TaxID=35525 RepID=UPI0006E0ADB0|nr:sodium- and chloride-dependent transporter XTRP3 [Daphnia magna]